MKKLNLFFLIIFFGSFGFLNAEPIMPEISSGTTEHWYYIEFSQRDWPGGSNNRYLYDQGDNRPLIAVSPVDADGILWKIEETETTGEYRIVSKRGNSIAYTPSAISDTDIGDNCYYSKETATERYKFEVNNTNYYKLMRVGGSGIDKSGSSPYFDNYGSGEGVSVTFISESSLTLNPPETPPVTLSPTEGNPGADTWYYLFNNKRMNDNHHVITDKNNTITQTAITEYDANQLWKIVKSDPTERYQFINKGTGNKIDCSGSAIATAATSFSTFKFIAGTNGNAGFYVISNNEKNLSINKANDNDTYSLWGSPEAHDPGNCVRFFTEEEGKNFYAPLLSTDDNEHWYQIQFSRQMTKAIEYVPDETVLKQLPIEAKTAQYWKITGTSTDDCRIESYSGLEIVGGTDRYTTCAKGEGHSFKFERDMGAKYYYWQLHNNTTTVGGNLYWDDNSDEVGGYSKNSDGVLLLFIPVSPAPEFSVSAPNVDFGAAPINEGTPQTLSVAARNLPGTILHEITGDNAFAVAPAESWSNKRGGDLTITFTPTENGKDYSATLKIKTEDQNDIEIALLGSGSAGPIITATPSALDFGEIIVGSTQEPKTITVSIANRTGDIAYAKDGTGKEAFILTESSWNATTGGVLNVTFNPTAAGDYSATIAISSTDADTKTVTLTGTAVLLPVSLSTGSGVTVTETDLPTSVTYDYDYVFHFTLAPGYHSPKVLVNGGDYPFIENDGTYTVSIDDIREAKTIRILAFPANVLLVTADTYVQGGSNSNFSSSAELWVERVDEENQYHFRTYLWFDATDAIKNAGYNRVKLRLVGSSMEGRSEPLYMEVREVTETLNDATTMTWTTNSESFADPKGTAIENDTLIQNSGTISGEEFVLDITDEDILSKIANGEQVLLLLNALRPDNTYSNGHIRFHSKENTVDPAFIPQLIFEKIPTPGEEVDVSKYIGYQGDLVFTSNDDNGTSHLTYAGDESSVSFPSPGKVKLVKTFTTDRWYPIGFPFEIDNNNITIKYGTESVTGVIYDGDQGDHEFSNSGSVGNFFVKEYNAENNYFVFTDAIAANTGYIVEFPAGEFESSTEVEVTFVSTESPTLTIGATGADIPGGNTNLSLVVNSNVSNITGIGNAMDYYQYDYSPSDPRFTRIGSGSTVTLSTPLKPFEAIVAVKTGTDESAFRSAIGDGSGGFTALEALPGLEELQEVLYYTLQGVRIYSPQVNGVYIVKKIYASGKTDISKIIYKNKE